MIQAANYFPYSELMAGDFFVFKDAERPGTFQKINKTTYQNSVKEVFKIEPDLEAHRTKVCLAYVRNLF